MFPVPSAPFTRLGLAAARQANPQNDHLNEGGNN